MKNKRSLLLSILSFCAVSFLALPPFAQAQTPAFLLAQTLQADTDVRAYLVSEKYDGVRALWDGQEFRTRSGARIHAPTWFIADFPKQRLDGELWVGRGRFDELSGAVRKQIPLDTEWRTVRYMVFELPEAPGTFRERAQAIEKIVQKAAVPWLAAVAQSEVADRKTLETKLAQIVKAGGEGLMLHRADALYSTGRSDALLKMKAWHDAEATVLAHSPGKGKYQGVLGALRVRNDAGVVFNLGTGLNEATRANPPPIGSRVTYRYRELTRRGVPRFASYYRVRNEP